MKCWFRHNGQRNGIYFFLFFRRSAMVFLNSKTCLLSWGVLLHHGSLLVTVQLLTIPESLLHFLRKKFVFSYCNICRKNKIFLPIDNCRYSVNTKQGDLRRRRPLHTKVFSCEIIRNQASHQLMGSTVPVKDVTHVELWFKTGYYGSRLGIMVQDWVLGWDDFKPRLVHMCGNLS